MWTPSRWNPVVVIVTITTTVTSVLETSALSLPILASRQDDSTLEMSRTHEPVPLHDMAVVLNDPLPKNLNARMPRIRQRRAAMPDYFELGIASSGSPIPLPMPDTHVRDAQMPVVPRSVIGAADDACPAALQMLQRDFAGHGLPLTSLVIEASTFVLLAIFVVYFIRQRIMARRAQTRLFAPSSSFAPAASIKSRNSVLKHCSPSPAPTQPSLTKIDEDPSPSSASSHASSSSQLSLLPPVHVALSPQRGTSPAPSRSMFRSPSLSNLSAPTPGLVEKPSFLSLKN
ncbi:hypothetical protein BN946_scf185016.g95 [Trametes cinnabarina]|uniref:Uncharacterized protein n=1 Tax=Pycnoporus cinnabarinus TaxID=5643 RepID=A0A060SND5_PYCCI|nr:hypothetical protein BN946_scf185016.g95 [Trametes cinnabarina]